MTQLDRIEKKLEALESDLAGNGKISAKQEGTNAEQHKQFATRLDDNRDRIVVVEGKLYLLDRGQHLLLGGWKGFLAIISIASLVAAAIEAVINIVR